MNIHLISNHFQNKIKTSILLPVCPTLQVPMDFSYRIVELLFTFDVELEHLNCVMFFQKR